MHAIAILITCHNRKVKTLACLDALFINVLSEKCSLQVYLVDDGSTDDTAQAVCERYPQVNIIKGDGSLYWNGGMRVAFAAAMEIGFDYYLWLNDDTLLYPNAIESLITTICDLKIKLGKSVIAVGSIQDASDGQLTYGGVVRASKWRPTTFTLVAPRDVPVECGAMNGNCVLIPNEIAQALGNMEPKFVHAMGDLDYGLRACQVGFSVWVMPSFAGTCSYNAVTDSFTDPSLTVSARLRKVMQSKGLPFSSWRIFTQRYAGAFWPIFWVWPYLKIILKGFVKK